jgi:ABC-2 type transport system permease protein
MLKLIKYELRATYLTILGICITVIIANLLLYTKKGSWDDSVIPILSMCLAIGAIIVIFISSLKIMSRYLHGEEGYLLFTLPQSGASVIGSRLITALAQISIVGFISLLMFSFTIPQEANTNLLKEIKANEILFSIIGYIWATISSLTLIYFCMIIGKVALKGKKLGRIGSFIIFIIISLALSWISSKLTTLFPQILNFGGSPINNNFQLLINFFHFQVYH